MTERRGKGNWWEHKRWIEFCPHCNTTCTFESSGDKMRCVGDQRAGRQGCGTELPLHTDRSYGNCLTCRQVRRAFKVPNGNHFCCYCMQPVTEVEEFKG